MTCVTSGGDIVIELWYDSGGGWTSAGSYTDTGAVATYPNLAAAGYAGVSTYYSSAANTTYGVDDFAAGEISTWTPETNSAAVIRTVTSGARW